MISRIFYLLLFFTIIAHAHQSKENYITIKVQNNTLILTCDIETDNFENVLKLDDNHNNIISWNELYKHKHEIQAYILNHIFIIQNTQNITLKVSDYKIYRREDQSYLSLTLRNDTYNSENSTLFDYQLFFDIDPLQRLFLSRKKEGQEIIQIFSPHQPRQNINSEKPSLFKQFNTFWKEGIWHIWIGFDHLLFLLMLLLPALIEKKGKVYQRVPSLRSALLKTLSIITLFSVAHSLTLSAAFLDLASLNSKVVESLIAFSIILTAFFNLIGYIPKRIYVLIFIFGLLHGFGFANALGEISLSHLDMIITLIGFNLGVESGQILLLLPLFPLLFILAKYRVYQTFIIKSLSLLTLILSVHWLIQRLFNVTL